MKLHLPLHLRAALLAALVTVSFTAFFPAWAEDEDSLTETKVYEHNETWTDRITESMTLDSYAEINISGRSDRAIYLSDSSNAVTISNSGEIVFSENKLSNDNGGAIYNSGTLSFDGNGDITFTGNSSSYGSSGAIYNSSYYSTLSFTGNGDITFTGNSAAVASSYGGAIYNFEGTLSFESNGGISFSGNSSASSGGAIWNCGTLNFTGNVGITFSGNSTTTSSYSYGGASWNSGTLSFEGNGDITFSGNSAASYYSSYGGAICNSYDCYNTMTFSGNGDITFSGNFTTSSTTSSYGGAIYNDGTLRFTNNGAITFSDNSAAAASSYGGAIYNSSYSTLSFMGNGDITFTGNSSSYGGAIDNNRYGTLSFTGNGNIVFRGNYETSNRCLRSLYSDGGTVTLSATTGKSITFYDSIYISSDTTLELNKEYMDAKGNTVAATGAIVFSGATTEADLAAAFERNGITDAPTEAQILASRTSEIGSAVTLYAGSLEVRDHAVLQGVGLTVQESAATVGGTRVVLDNGTLNMAENNIDFATNTTLDLAGCNSISGNLIFQDNSALSFTLGKDNLTDALLTMNGNVDQRGFLNLHFDLAEGDTMRSGYKLITLTDGSTFDQTYWNDILVSVDGLGGTADFSQMHWVGNTLYYGAVYADESTWNGGSTSGTQTMVWNHDLSGWIGGDWDASLMVKFTDANAGEVTLEGNLTPTGVTVEATAGNDYVFSGSGSLTGDMVLTKNGESVLTIHTENSFTGGTIINEGTVVVGNEKALGLGGILLKNGVLNLMNNALQNAITAEGGLLAGLSAYQGDLIISGEVQTEGAAHAESWTFREDAGKLSLGGSTIEATDGADGQISAATIEHTEVAGKDTVSISGTGSDRAALDNIHIDMAKGSVLVFNGATLSSTVRITDDPAMVLFNGTSLVIDNGVNVTRTEVAQVSGLELVDGNGAAVVSYQGMLTRLEIESDALTSVTVDGTSLTLSFMDFDLTDIDFVRLVFGNGASAVHFANGTSLSVTGIFGGQSYTGLYQLGDNEAVYFDLKRELVPEPASSTLGLLALAAFVSRRRRKAA